MQMARINTQFSRDQNTSVISNGSRSAYTQEQLDQPYNARARRLREKKDRIK